MHSTPMYFIFKNRIQQLTNGTTMMNDGTIPKLEASDKSELLGI
jgi:hypothetical protein